MEETHPTSRLFGRRKGRPLRVRKSRLIETLLPELRIDIAAGEKVSVRTLFPGLPAADLWLEIGFGGGEHLAALAQRHADIAFIGCEPFLNGVASLLDHLEKNHIKNVRVFNNDARMILAALEDAALDRCYVLFADPWPKKRHAERRFIGAETLQDIARVLKPGGLLRLASDHLVLIDWMRECLVQSADFSCTKDSPDPPEDWLPTRYQEKAVTAGRTPIFMDYRRTAKT